MDRSRRLLTKEQIAELEKNPSIAKVTANTVTFTPEFKKIAYQQLVNGKSMRSILREIGVDPDVLGNSRLWGMAEKLRKNAEREEGYTDLRKGNRRKGAKETPERTDKERLKLLEHKVAYMEQVIEFLKKVQAADTEARMLWDSKHRQE